MAWHRVVGGPWRREIIMHAKPSNGLRDRNGMQHETRTNIPRTKTDAQGRRYRDFKQKFKVSFFLYKSNKGTTSSCSRLGFQHSPGALVLQRDIITKLRVLVLESGALFGVPFPFWNFFYVSPLRSFQQPSSVQCITLFYCYIFIFISISAGGCPSIFGLNRITSRTLDAMPR